MKEKLRDMGDGVSSNRHLTGVIKKKKKSEISSWNNQRVNSLGFHGLMKEMDL